MPAKDTASTQSACFLFRIPREIRDIIYEFALFSREPIDVDYFTRPSHQLTALLETCWTIRKEASSIFFGLNMFVAVIRIPYLNTCRKASTRIPRRLVILIVEDDGSKAYSIAHTRDYLEHVWDTFVKPTPLECLVLSFPESHPHETRRTGQDYCDEEHIRLSGQVGDAILEELPTAFVDWSLGGISEWLRFEKEDAMEDAESVGDSDADPIGKASSKALLFGTRVRLLRDIPAKRNTTGQLEYSSRIMDQFRDTHHPRETELKFQEQE
ncbi:hypothetical protein LTR54_017619 [Friedmanniomyces endolithicus]|nr:hypothetical protein LTR54_017619 [Friedmanniomyces endolithicus]